MSVQVWVRTALAVLGAGERQLQNKRWLDGLLLPDTAQVPTGDTFFPSICVPFTYVLFFI